MTSRTDPPLRETQLDLLLRASTHGTGQIMIDPKTQNADWCAMKRMVKRGLFARQSFGNSRYLGYVVVYTITDAGQTKLQEAINARFPRPSA